MKLRKYTRKDISKLNNLMIWMAVPLLVIFFSYFFLLGKDCVIEINDQLDETLFTYVLNAKYLFSGVKSYPEMLCGVPKGGMSVSACLFISLYHTASCQLFYAKIHPHISRRRDNNILCHKSPKHRKKSIERYKKTRRHAHPAFRHAA